MNREVFVRISAHFVKLYASSVLVNFLRDGLWGMLFLTNEPAKKAEINILTARDTTGPGY